MTPRKAVQVLFDEDTLKVLEAMSEKVNVPVQTLIENMIENMLFHKIGES